MILYNALLHQITIAVQSRQKATSLRHEKKLTKFRKNQTHPRDADKITIMKTIHNYPSYVLSNEEITALSYGLDNHIPSNINKNAVTTEFEMFFQNLLRNLSHIPENEISKIKTKLRSTCENIPI